MDEPVDDLAGDLVDTLAVLIRRDLELSAARRGRALASEVVQYERDELAQGAEHLRETVEHETDVFLRELVSAPLGPGRRGIGLLEPLAERGRAPR